MFLWNQAAGGFMFISRKYFNISIFWRKNERFFRNPPFKQTHTVAMVTYGLKCIEPGIWKHVIDPNTWFDVMARLLIILTLQSLTVIFNLPPFLFIPCSTCSITLKAFLAAHPPMDTWSSVAALVESESTEEGWHSTLFSETAKKKKKEMEIEHVIM